MCGRMALGQGNQHVLIDDGLDAQAIVAAVNGPHECDIDRVTADRRDQAGCCPFFKRECDVWIARSEEHTSELQSLMRISYAVFCLKKKKQYMTKITLHESH